MVVYSHDAARLRAGIAMIELIFALVVMGIVLMSAPRLVQTSINSAYTSLQQESIASAASEITTMLSTEWDEADTNSTIGVPILKTSESICTADNPPGVTSTSGRYCKDALNTNTLTYNATSPINLGPDGSETYYYDDIDDYKNDNNVSYEVNETTTTYEGDVIDKQIAIKTNVIYGNLIRNISGSAMTCNNPFDATLTSTTTDVKLVTIQLTTTSSVEDLNKSIRMSAFVCNIGAPKEILTNKGSL